MAVIDNSRDALLVILERVTREHGSTVVANFALDEQLNRTEAAYLESEKARQFAEADAKAVREQLEVFREENIRLRALTGDAKAARTIRRRKRT